MSSGFTASRKGSRTILTTLKGISTAGNAHIRAVELRAAQDDALNESHKNITESNIKLAETTRLQAQVVATGAQLISVSADHYRRMQDDHRRMQDNLRTQATEIQQLKRQIEELRNNDARVTLPTPSACHIEELNGSP
jgi:cellobiose-specific phosphotransferase system component IIA